MKRLVILIFTVSLIPGCRSPEEQVFEREPNILALMLVSDLETYQRVRVDQSYDIMDTVDLYGLRDAKVRVWGGEDTFVFLDSFYDSDSAKWTKYDVGKYYCVANFKDTIPYRMEVILPWEDTVIAQAYMPSPIQISAPVDSDTVSISKEPYDPHVIIWNSCRNTELYLVYCIPDVDTSKLDDISPLYSLPAFTTDTSYAFFLERMVFPWGFNMHYVLRVIAVTPEYIDYMGFLNPTGESRSNLSSGYGMFGGISEDSIRVFITE